MNNDLDQQQAVQNYHRWYYETGVWERVSFLGIPCLKSVSDMWNYQEILFELRPTLVVEFGTWAGGSALYFSAIGRLVDSRLRVLTVDIDGSRVQPQVLEQQNIEFMQASTVAPVVGRRIRELQQETGGPTLAILDSDHSKNHVLAELDVLRPLLNTGDYVIVEDGNINGHPVLPGWGEGPYEAVEEYLSRHPEDYSIDKDRETKFGFTFAPRGFLRRL